MILSLRKVDICQCRSLVFGTMWHFALSLHKTVWNEETVIQKLKLKLLAYVLTISDFLATTYTIYTLSC